MKDTFSVLFFLKVSKAKSDGTVPIYVRITANGSRSEVSIKRYISKERWNSSKAKAKGTNQESQLLNKYIDIIQSKVLDAHQTLIQEGKHISGKSIKNKYLGVDEYAKKLIEVYQYHNQRIEELIGIEYQYSTYSKFKTSLMHLSNFIQSKYNVDDIPLIDLQYMFITSYEHYLKATLGLGINTSNKYLMHLKKVITLAIDNEWLVRNPFNRFKMKNKPSERVFLIEDELIRIIQTPILNQRISEVRDVFVFCCLTGLAYSDVKSLSSNDVTKGIDGKMWIRKHRKKTGSLSRISIVPYAIELIERYKDHPEANTKEILFPVISNQRMNIYLKDVGTLCNIDKKLTVHMARHTFGTYTTTLGVPIETIGQMMGHKSIKTTQIYANIIDKKIANDMEDFSNKLPEFKNKAS
jgi:site-specific recombinase XerD